MSSNKLLEAQTVVQCLWDAMRDGEGGLEHVPGLLLRLIKEDMWQDRLVPQTGEIKHYDRFLDFISTHPPEGLGASLGRLRRLCSDNPQALDALDEVTKQEVGAPIGNQNAAKTIFDNVQDCSIAPTGNSATAALRRLRKDAPALHTAVLDGALSPHAAMVAAGFRPKTISINIASPERAAAAIQRACSPEFIAALIALLAEAG